MYRSGMEASPVGAGLQAAVALDDRMSHCDSDSAEAEPGMPDRHSLPAGQFWRHHSGGLPAGQGFCEALRAGRAE